MTKYRQNTEMEEDTNDQKKKLSPGDIAGIVIGSIAALLIIIYVNRKRKERNYI